jgi:hypothetical protein
MATKAQETATRLSDQLAAQAREARAVGLDTLAYLIDMARVEAEQQARDA